MVAAAAAAIVGLGVMCDVVQASIGQCRRTDGPMWFILVSNGQEQLCEAGDTNYISNTAGKSQKSSVKAGANASCVFSDGLLLLLLPPQLETPWYWFVVHILF